MYWNEITIFVMVFLLSSVMLTFNLLHIDYFAHTNDDGDMEYKWELVIPISVLFGCLMVALVWWLLKFGVKYQYNRVREDINAINVKLHDCIASKAPMTDKKPAENIMGDLPQGSFKFVETSTKSLEQPRLAEKFNYDPVQAPTFTYVPAQ